MTAQFPTKRHKTITTRGGAKLTIPGGMQVPADFRYVETKDYLIEKCMAAWATTGGDGLPLDFRLVGPPGVGKNVTVYALAARRQQPLYIVQGHEELTAEDLVVSATLASGGKVKYIASPLLAAMREGAICFIDEIAKMRPRALAPLASVLDQRRSIYSSLLGEEFPAHPDFRFCAAYNPTDADAFDLAPWLKRRTLPELEVSLPDVETLEEIIRLHDVADGTLCHTVISRLREMSKGHRVNIDAGTAIRLMTYIRRLDCLRSDGDIPLGDVVEIAIRTIAGQGINKRKGEPEEEE
ncbi:MAG: AAA family ATPase [Chthoniobacter sp.]|nr:AAA family ATPase [Chthoniobacter sp.]